MTKSIRISDKLMEQAKRSATLFHRSPPQQIEHWAHIGQVMEAALSYPAQAQVKTWGSEEDIDELIDEVASEEGQRKILALIAETSGDHRFNADTKPRVR